MLKCSTSLWSADLANLESEIKRVAPYSERFHIDVADGHHSPTLLFFPDLVKAMRPHTTVPFEAHLMTTDPLAWLDPFIEAGVDGFIVCHDSVADLGEALAAIHRRGRNAGVSLRIEEPLDLLDRDWDRIDTLCLINTAVGVKGASMDPSIPDKIRQARRIVEARGLRTVIMSDGGIRRQSVPLIGKAGADFIVPGSLMFKEDPAAMRQWLARRRGTNAPASGPVVN